MKEQTTQMRVSKGRHIELSKAIVRSGCRGQSFMAFSCTLTNAGKRDFSTSKLVLLEEGKLAHTIDPKVKQNAFGIQYLAPSLKSQVFINAEKSKGKKIQKKYSPANAPKFMEDESQFLSKLAVKGLKNHNLYGKKTSINSPIEMKLPKLQGFSLDEHFQKLGKHMSEPYLSMAKSKFTKTLPKPEKWEMKSGSWIRYAPGSQPEKVDFPLEDLYVFDVETLPKISPYPILATALSDKAWYSWCSPFLTNYVENNKTGYEHLIPLDTQNPQRKQLIIGHNVSYDRARVLEEYNFKQSNAFFLDTLSLHLGTAGMCSRQRNLWQKATKVLRNNGKLEKELASKESSETRSEEESDEFEDEMVGFLPQSGSLSIEGVDSEDILKDDPWVKVTTMNSLKECALFYCGINLEKDKRDVFVTSTDKRDVINDFQNLCNYCAEDVIATSLVFDKVFHNFLQKTPHPVSFGALKMISQCFLPTNANKWESYIKNAEELYQSSKIDIENKVIDIVQDLVKLKDNPEIYLNDPWLKQLDWTIKPLKLTKQGVPYKRQKLPGFPEWYKNLFPTASSEKPVITIKSREIPLLFKLSWENKPVVWCKEDGWCFDVFEQKEIEIMREKSYQEVKSSKDSKSSGVRFKVPHPNGPENRTTTLLSKPFVHFFEKGVLTAVSPVAQKALQINASGSYWMSARQRIMNQWVVSKEKFPTEFNFNSPMSDGQHGEPKSLPLESTVGDDGMIIPKIIPMGTVTRRAVENCWLTASNAKKNRIGSELKSLIKAPDGYSFVGADVDSEELWIASLVGDSVFKTHGATPVGWMCLEGSKNEGTDLHTKTAQILGCTRNEAKIFNYGRIYGAGLKFAAQLLKQFVPSMSDKETVDVATNLYKETKGKKINIPTVGTIWYGGSESVLFNRLEEISDQDIPQTPILGASITDSLLKGNLKKRSFLTSRINWVIQSSGVDYLHLLCCSMNYLIERYQIDARMVISIHDEIRFLVKNEDKHRAAMALQISNLWTRAMFCEQLGMNDLPQNCAFFSAVDIDFVLRKEVDMDCITPSNQVSIEHGETLDIYKLMSMADSALGKPLTHVDFSKYEYEPREKVVETLEKRLDPLLKKYLVATEVQNRKTVADALIKEYKDNYLQKSFVDEYNKLLDETIDFNDPLRKKKIGQPEKESQFSFKALKKSLEYKPQSTQNSSLSKVPAMMEEPSKKRKTARTKMFNNKTLSKQQTLNKDMLPEDSVLNEILQSSYQSALAFDRCTETGLPRTGKMLSSKKKKKFSQYDKFIQNQKEDTSFSRTLSNVNPSDSESSTVSS